MIATANGISRRAAGYFQPPGRGRAGRGKPMKYQHIVVQTSCPDGEVAERLATALVEARLVACAQAAPIRSVYRWNGAVHRESECLLILKTRADRYAAVEARIRALHPYELPEIIAVPVLEGSSAYLSWLDAESSDVASDA